ncbi:MAG: glycogen(starch) synthase [Parcubacteria bacterium C7867-003]|nr:MAG: glycogen(starch) synthase [Parcubacteria bacterium C7867-003]
MIKFNNMQLGKVSKSKTKIGFLITKGVWGGAQKYLYALATNLPQEKYDVFVILGTGNILKNRLEEKGVKVYELNSLERDISILKELKNFLQIFNIIQRESPTIMHLNSPKASGLGAVVSRILLVPKTIQTVHGWSFNENRNIFSKILIYFFSWITVLLCDKTIVISKSEKNQALKMPFVSENKIVLIKNGVEKINYIEKQKVREALLLRAHKSIGDYPEQTLWIGTISELNKNKGLKYMISALSEIKIPFVFFVIGEGEERDGLEKLIIEKELQDKVFLIGFVDIANLYLKAFDIFSLTSEKEGLPYSIMEAGSASVPVIASDIGGIPDIVDSGKSGILVKKGNISEIKKAIETLASNPEKRIEFGNKLKQKIEKEFSLDQMTKKTLALYR